MRCITTYKAGVIDNETATNLYHRLINTIQWEDGIKSTKNKSNSKSNDGFTRKAKQWNVGYDAEIDRLLLQGIKAVTKQDYEILGIYINYYENGEMFTPNHSHKGTHQFVLSLGTTRTLKVGSKSYEMGNGDGIIFGSSIHGVPKVPGLTEGRISIATFMIPIDNNKDNNKEKVVDMEVREKISDEEIAMILYSMLNK